MLKYVIISETQRAALSRLISNLTSGYTRHTSGSIRADQVHRLALKFHRLHASAASPSQRHTRKKNGLANALLTFYLPPDADYAQWFLQFTPGDLSSHEKLQDATQKPFLSFSDYEIVRVAKGSNFKRATWSARRNKDAMTALYSELKTLVSKKQYRRIIELLERAAREPQFHLVREQTKRLFAAAKQPLAEAKKRGHDLNPPFLPYIQKISQGIKQPLKTDN